MTPNFTIKRSDTNKTISGQFLDANSAPVDCTGFSSPRFFVRDRTGTAVINGAAYTFTEVTTGKFRYIFTSGDLTAMTPAPRGNAFLRGEFKITLPGAVTATFPTDPDNPYLIIELEDDLS